MPGAYSHDAYRGSYITEPREKWPLGAHVSLGGKVSTEYHCDLSCRWATNKPSCIRDRSYLLAYFQKHGDVVIVAWNADSGLERCPMFEVPLQRPYEPCIACQRRTEDCEEFCQVLSQWKSAQAIRAHEMGSDR